MALSDWSFSSRASRSATIGDLDILFLVFCRFQLQMLKYREVRGSLRAGRVRTGSLADSIFLFGDATPQLGKVATRKPLGYPSLGLDASVNLKQKSPFVCP